MHTGHNKVRYLLNAAFETQDRRRRKRRILRIRISSYILKEPECWMLGDQSSRFRYVYPAVEGYSGSSGTGRWMLGSVGDVDRVEGKGVKFSRVPRG